MEYMNYAVLLLHEHITKYIDNNRITRKDTTTFAPAFPDRTMRNLIESEVIYRVAR